jgi:DNA-binding transcriptional regulator GbsR (MarR family)
LAQNDLAAALMSYRDCLAIRERLAQSDAGNADWQRDLAWGYAKLAKVQRQSNDPASASDALRRAQVIMEGLTKLSPDNADYRNLLAQLRDQTAGSTISKRSTTP